MVDYAGDTPHSHGNKIVPLVQTQRASYSLSLISRSIHSFRKPKIPLFITVLAGLILIQVLHLSVLLVMDIKLMMKTKVGVVQISQPLKSQQTVRGDLNSLVRRITSPAQM
jgi:hypothetical protein